MKDVFSQRHASNAQTGLQLDMNLTKAKFLRPLIHIVSIPLLMVAANGWAQSAEPASHSAQPAVAPVPQDNGLDSTLRQWRSLTLSQGTTRHDYREPDPLGRVNPLNSETGPIPTTELKLRWRGQLAQGLPEFVAQTHASYVQGQTDYSGYLQQGVTLTPYNARTGNTLQALSLRLGLPLNAFSRQQWAHHVVPYVEQRRNRWQRNLAQYGETFAWQTSSLGVMAVWSLADFGLPQFSRFALEADLSAGRTRNLHMDAPALGFAADLGSASSQSAALALHYEVTPTWLIGLRYEEQRMSFGASPTVAGLKYPGSSSKEQSLAVNFDYHF